jgi:pyrimidine-nucleoside phosphorylase
MNQPLGEAVGNALELKEAIQTLSGSGPADFRQHCLEVASHMLVLGKKAETPAKGRELCEQALAEGAALAKFKQLVKAQGGDLAVVEDPGMLPRAEIIEEAEAASGGWIERIDAREVGLTVVELGGGREKKGDPIDHSVGVIIHRKVGDRVESGDPLFTVHASSADKADAAKQRLMAAHSISAAEVEPLPLFYGTYPTSQEA